MLVAATLLSPACSSSDDSDQRTSTTNGAGVVGLTADFAEVGVAIGSPSEAVARWCALLADTEELRQQGLMEVTDLGSYRGMVFSWPEAAPRGFWMRNTPMPLSIVFLDEERVVLGGFDMVPCEDSAECPVYPFADPARYAIEVPQGDAEDLGLVTGTTVSFSSTCP